MTVTDPQTPPTNTRYTLSHLGIIEVAGQDASQFLQGQLTCNINEINQTKASFAAFCNPKGRVISTILLIKTVSGFWLILPRSLLQKVLQKLQMYVLRSKVQLKDSSDQLQMFGLFCPEQMKGVSLPTTALESSKTHNLTWIKLPSESPRFIGVMDTEQTIDSNLSAVKLGGSDLWSYQDISAGIPWFDTEQSEEYIPQMLNIDQLGGISFNKGCYTGQEIVARTHYLGKTKRQLFLGECHADLSKDSVSAVNDALTQEKLGDILSMQSIGNTSRLLIVLQTVDAEAKNLILDNASQTSVSLIPFQ